MSCVILPSILSILSHHSKIPQGLGGSPGKQSLSIPIPCSTSSGCLSQAMSVFPVTCCIGTLELPTPLIAAHQLYNYVADHASSYHMKPLRMARSGGPEHNEYALVSAWHR